MKIESVFVFLVLQLVFYKTYGQAYLVKYEQIVNFKDMSDTTDGILTINPSEKFSIYEYGKIDAAEAMSRNVHNDGKLLIKAAKKIDTIGSLIKTDLTTGDMKVREKLFGKYFLTNDSTSIKWGPNMKDTLINKMELKKTTCIFRGREYEVSYLPNRRMSGGPWKFNGLPGLIVEASDMDKEVVFKIKEIKEISDTLNIPELVLLPDIISFENYEKFRTYRNKLRDEDIASLAKKNGNNKTKKVIHYSNISIFYLEKD